MKVKSLRKQRTCRHHVFSDRLAFLTLLSADQRLVAAWTPRTQLPLGSSPRTEHT